MTWARVLERLAVLLGDVPTRLALAGLVGGVGASAGLVWWARLHYVAGPATGWRLTTWEKAMEAEDRSRESEGEEAEEACGRETKVGR